MRGGKRNPGIFKDRFVTRKHDRAVDNDGTRMVYFLFALEGGLRISLDAPKTYIKVMKAAVSTSCSIF